MSDKVWLLLAVLHDGAMVAKTVVGVETKEEAVVQFRDYLREKHKTLSYGRRVRVTEVKDAMVRPVKTEGA